VQPRYRALMVVTAALAVGCVACDGSDTQRDDPPQYKPGDQVDVNGDGLSDGVAVDANNDGIADGVDTNGDGVSDAALPDANGVAGANTGAAEPATNGSLEPNDCGGVVVQAKPTTADMLIVLDRSGSMAADGNDARVDRWRPSRSAVVSLTEKLDTQIRFGLMTFPSPLSQAGMMCAPDDYECLFDSITNGDGSSCTPGAINVPVALDTADKIKMFLDEVEPNGGTPTGPTLETALEALNPDAVSPDAVISPKFVLLVTDGQPTCPTGRGRDVNPTDIAQSTKAIDGLLAKGVKTYVIGYDTKSDASLASVLDEFATHGDTGTHRAVEDEASLLAEFQKIAGEIVSCSYQLDKAPKDPSYVLVKLDGKQLNLDQPDGWSITGRAVTLEGQACKTLQDGKEHTLNVVVECDVVPVI